MVTLAAVQAIVKEDAMQGRVSDAWISQSRYPDGNPLNPKPYKPYKPYNPYKPYKP